MKNSGQTLGDILYVETVCNMTDFEKKVMEDIIDFGEETFGLTRYECLSGISNITKEFWKKKLD